MRLVNRRRYSENPVQLGDRPLAAAAAAIMTSSSCPWSLDLENVEPEIALLFRKCQSSFVD